VLFAINVAFGIAVGTGLYLIGIPNAILWGILAAVLRFVPYVGQAIAAGPPICLALAISTGWLAPLLTIGLFAVLGVFFGSVLEPWLYGKGTGVSAVAVLVTAVFWTWLWGIIGLLLATPLTVCLLVIGKHVPQLAFLDILLGNEPVFEPKRLVYQRLLAGDQEEAVNYIDDDLEHRPLAAVYDSLLIPALALAETDWHHHDLDEARHAFVLQSLREIIQECGDRLRPTPPKEGGDDDTASRPQILCLPARDEADEIAGMMLAQLLSTGECLVQSARFTIAISELVTLVARHKPDVVCISATPPAAVMHARHLCARIRDRFPELPVIVGLWDAQGDLTKAIARIGGGSATQVVTTLTAAQEQVRLLIEPHVRHFEQQHGPDSVQPIAEQSLQQHGAPE